MKTKTIMLSLLLSAGVIFTSCQKDDDDNPSPKPVINLTEIGEGDTHGNDHTAKIGGEMHIEAEIVAEGKIDKISIKLHPESEHMLKALLDGWELDTTYTKFAGLKNTNFHEHIEIDASAVAGTYHFDFIVTDMEGNQSSAEAEVVITE